MDKLFETPIKAIHIPIIFFIPGLSFNKKKAIITPKGTSACTRSTADDASIIFKPEYVKPYCKVLPINETIIKSLNNPLGIGNHQIRIKAARVKRKPINKNGGNCCIAGFAITKPNPKKIGTDIAIIPSRNFICSSYRMYAGA